jgi:hypothetical protein
MTAVLIDANGLLDVMTEDARWFEWSAEAIEHAADRHRLVINPIIYAEFSIRYSRIENSTPRFRSPCSTAKRFLTKPPFSQASRSHLPRQAGFGRQMSRFRAPVGPVNSARIFQITAVRMGPVRASPSPRFIGVGGASLRPFTVRTDAKASE